MVERELAGSSWATGEDFTLADCAAAPALVLCRQGGAVRRDAIPTRSALLERLKARPSVARVLAEAEPYFHYFPTGMTAFSQRVAELTGIAEDRLERLAGESDLRRCCWCGAPTARLSVAKQGPAIAAEAAMLRALAGGGPAGARGRRRA